MPIAAHISNPLGSNLNVTCENPECGDKLAIIVLVRRNGGAKQKSLMFGTDTDFAKYCTT